MIETSGHSEIYECPGLTSEDLRVLGEIHTMRVGLAAVMRTPRRWTGGLRRSMLAKAIRGSNSIEGYVVAEDEAAAALDDEEPVTPDRQTFAGIGGFRQTPGFCLQMAEVPHF